MGRWLVGSAQVYITETYKMPPASTARTHTVDRALVTMLYAQRTIADQATHGKSTRYPAPSQMM